MPNPLDEYVAERHQQLGRCHARRLDSGAPRSSTTRSRAYGSVGALAEARSEKEPGRVGDLPDTLSIMRVWIEPS
jgi:hypothetical protein